MKLGILSDTHNLLRPQVLSALRGVDVILHAGDVSRRTSSGSQRTSRLSMRCGGTMTGTGRSLCP